MVEGILPVCKPKGSSSFSLVSILRKATGVRTIGHAGTLDPFATGVMILLIGKPFTRKSDQFLGQDKEYIAQVHLGIETDTYDSEGQIVAKNDRIPSLSEIETALLSFQGTILQIPPMFSAKKIGGKKLYELARKGVVIERAAASVTLHTSILSYTYPHLELHVRCSKGTYIRSLAHDLGALLGTYAHLSELSRTKSGAFSLADCCDGKRLLDPEYSWQNYLHRT